MRMIMAVCGALLWSVLVVSPVRAATASVRDEAVARCAAMRTTDLSDQPDTRARVLNAIVGTPYSDAPEVCQLDGYIEPTIGFRIVLPLQGWNGKYVQTGCGGACGTTLLYWCAEPLRRGYACASTDMGHTSTLADWNWARDNLQGKVDFGFRSTHLTALVGKALTARYFGRQPTHAYFSGCSTGGRQALVEAESFPWDFDGIIASAPPVDETGTSLQLAWSVRANLDAGGKPVLDETAVRLLHQAVVAVCDMNDGLDDGLIGDPRQCRVDLEKLQCRGGGAAQCLNEAQIGAVRKIYSGPVDSQGRPIGHTGGAMPGSELYWLGDYVYGNGREPQYAAFIENFLRYMAFDPAAGPSWKLADLDVERDTRRLSNEMLFSASNPDLRRFKSAGGKIIGFQGWADTSVVPMQYVDFYQAVTRAMGGPQNTLDFYRFYAVPGMRHCSADGDGGDMIDSLTALEQWVEQGKAPETLVGYNFDWSGLTLRAPVWPLDPAHVKFSRPVYQYPAVPFYKGKGDPKLAENFRPSK